MRPPPRRSVLRVTLGRSLGFASVALLAACSFGDLAPEAPSVANPTPDDAPARLQSCRSNDDCSADHAGGLCLPKATTKELSDGEDLLGRAMVLRDLVTHLGDASGASPLIPILTQVQDDLHAYSEWAQGNFPADAGGPLDPNVRPTKEEIERMQDAAWFQSGATQAFYLIKQFVTAFSTAPISTDAQRVSADLTDDGHGLRLDRLTSDLQPFLHDLDGALEQLDSLVDYRFEDGGVPDLKSAAGALIRYIGPTLKTLNDARGRVGASLDPSTISQLQRDLALVSRGHDVAGRDGTLGTCLESR